MIAVNGDGIWNREGASLRVVVIPPFYRRWWFLVLVALAAGGAVYLAYRDRVARLEKRQAAQEAFAQQLIASQERERKRIAAELHDSLGQTLLIIKNRSLLASLTPQEAAAAKRQFDEITSSTTQAIEEVRQIAHNLRPYHLDNLGLTNSLEAMIDKVESVSGIRFSYDIAPLDGALPQEGEINLYRIIQEAINNIVKHSQATRARVEVARDERGIYLTIRDNGQGFDLKATTAERRRRGFGLNGIAERVRMLGGTYHLDSAPSAGTTLTVELALENARKGKRDEA